MLDNISDRKDFSKSLDSFDAVKTILESMIFHLAQGDVPFIIFDELYEKVEAEEGGDRANQVAQLFRNGIVEAEGGVPLAKISAGKIEYTSIAHILFGIVRMNGNPGLRHESLFASLLEHMKIIHLVESDLSRWVKNASPDLMPPKAEPPKVEKPIIKFEKPIKIKSQAELIRDFRAAAGGITRNIRSFNADSIQYWVNTEKMTKVLAKIPPRHLMGWMQDKKELAAMLRQVEFADDKVAVDDVVRVLKFICYPLAPFRETMGRSILKQINNLIATCPEKHCLDVGPK